MSPRSSITRERNSGTAQGLSIARLAHRPSFRHGRARPGHPRLVVFIVFFGQRESFEWIAVTHDATRTRGASYRDPKRFFAASVAGIYSETAVPSGSRNWNVLLPHGIILSSCTSFTLSFRRTYSASMSSTWNSRQAVRL